MPEETCNGNLDILQSAVSFTECLSLVFDFTQQPSEKKKRNQRVKNDVRASFVVFQEIRKVEKILNSQKFTAEINP